MNFIRKILSKGHNNAQFAFIARGSFGFNRTTMGGARGRFRRDRRKRHRL